MLHRLGFAALSVAAPGGELESVWQALELENVGCLACGTAGTTPWGGEAGFNAVRCVACGLVYVTPRPIAAAQSEAARTGSHRRADGELVVTGSYSLPRELGLRARLIRLYGYRGLRSLPKRWLDLGCGHGELLTALRSVLSPDSEIIGVEPNETKRRGALERGLLVHASLDDVEGAFDAISLMNVYSHLPDPLATFSALTAQLLPNGEILLETGNGAELDSSEEYPGALDLPDHLSFAGERQLETMLGSTGFEISHIQRARLDGLVGTAWELAKSRGHGARWRRPFRSNFRDLYIRARLG